MVSPTTSNPKTNDTLLSVRLFIDMIDLQRTAGDGSENLMLILKIFQWQLRRHQLGSIATLEQLSTLKHGLREAEILFKELFQTLPAEMCGWFMSCEPRNKAQGLGNMLCDAMLSMTIEISGVEGQHPHLKPQFDLERARYRKRLEEAREAEQD